MKDLLYKKDSSLNRIKLKKNSPYCPYLPHFASGWKPYDGCVLTLLHLALTTEVSNSIILLFDSACPAAALYSQQAPFTLGSWGARKNIFIPNPICSCKYLTLLFSTYSNSSHSFFKAQLMSIPITKPEVTCLQDIMGTELRVYNTLRGQQKYFLFNFF